jgi:23S rRNA (cytidine1920-2'-O)/16S rRNA (cytidine1409-2'-O)-methyltransferase
MTREHHVSKQRLDSILVDRGLVSSREQAGRVILAGLVTVNGTMVDKRAKLVDEGASIEVADLSSSYVSRAGDKLVAAIEAFHLPCQGLIAMDIGASTGGFTDCLLRQGVKRVYAIDVGYGQLDWRLRNDDRVVVLERCNIRYLPVETIPEPIALAVIDVSFISLRLVLPCVIKFLSAQAIVIALVKPQFEAGRKQVGRGGIVRDDAVRQAVIDNVRSTAEDLGFSCLGHFDSPVEGKSGNREMLLGLRWGPESDPC